MHRDFGRAVDAAPAFFVSLSPAGETLAVNEPLREALGYERGEGLGGDFASTFVAAADRDAFAEVLREVRGGGRPQVRALKLVAKTGEEREVEWHASPVAGAGGELGSIAGVALDLAPRRRIGALLEQSQRMEAAGFMAGGVAHDLNNLLMSLQSSVSLMLLDVDDTIERQVQAGSQLTRQLLGHSVASGSGVQRLDLNTLIRDTSQTFANVRREVRMELDLAEELPRIEAHRQQIEQVLVNLYVNATYTMPDGAPLRLASRAAVGREVEERGLAVGSPAYVLVTLTNIGEGVPSGETVLLPKQTGDRLSPEALGLTSAASLLEGLGGFLTVEPAPDGGGTYFAGIPAVGDVTGIGALVAETHPAGRANILLVDDEERILQLSSKVLRRLGFTVFEARGGAEALQVYAQKRDTIDLVLLDLAMPEIDGAEAFDRLRTLDPKVKVILMSGYPQDVEATRMLQRGAVAFLQKPFSMRDVSRRIRKILRQR